MATFCRHCATAVQPQMTACPRCGATLALAGPPPRGADVLGAAPVWASPNPVAAYPKASSGLRVGADLIDSLVLPAVLILLVVVIGVVGGAQAGVLFVLMLIPAFLLFWLYRFVKDGFGGAGLGKRASGLMVVHLTTNTPCSLLQSTLRQILYVVPFMLIVEFILMLTDEKGRRLGDRIADTQVIDAALYAPTVA
jgi:uncharacterized RDD family membrane protein YckC